MEDNRIERTHPLTLIAFKFAWAALLTLMALPTALEWGLKPSGIITPIVCLGGLVAVAVTPLLVAHVACERNYRALRTLRRMGAPAKRT